MRPKCILKGAMPKVQFIDEVFNDPRLPHLAAFLDPGTFSPKFVAHYAASLARHKLTLRDGCIERIQHKRGKRCRVLYRLRFDTRDGGQRDEWFYGKLVKSGQAEKERSQLPNWDSHAGGPWPPVDVWPEWDFLLWSFPNDPEMPKLNAAADKDLICSAISENLDKFDRDLTWRCDRVQVHRVKYMPGKRCVMRIDAVLRNRQAERKKLVFFSKSYADGNALACYRLLNHLHNQFNHIVTIPRPILYLDQANTFWQESWNGKPLARCLLELPQWENCFERLGHIVAAFHRQPDDELTTKFDFDSVMQAADEDARMLAWLLPTQSNHYLRVLDKLQAVRSTWPEKPPVLAPIHGALRIEQFMMHKDAFALLDYDAVSLGDPLFDVAEFITSLQYMQCSRGFSKAKIDAAVAAFRRNYFDAVPWPCDEQRLAWYATAFLLAKIYDSVKNLDRGALKRIDQALSIQSAWLAELANSR